MNYLENCFNYSWAARFYFNFRDVWRGRDKRKRWLPPPPSIRNNDGEKGEKSWNLAKMWPNYKTSGHIYNLGKGDKITRMRGGGKFLYRFVCPKNFPNWFLNTPLLNLNNIPRADGTTIYRYLFIVELKNRYKNHFFFEAIRPVFDAIFYTTKLFKFTAVYRQNMPVICQYRISFLRRFYSASLFIIISINQYRDFCQDILHKFRSLVVNLIL